MCQQGRGLAGAANPSFFFFFSAKPEEAPASGVLIFPKLQIYFLFLDYTSLFLVVLLC
jgi:hypothetical protein